MDEGIGVFADRRGTITALAVAALIFMAFPATATELEVTIINVAPVVVSVSLPAQEISPTAGATTGVLTTILVEDLNGCSDIASVKVTILKPDGTTTHVAAADATFKSCALGTTATYEHTFNMLFYDAPALDLDRYKAKVVATDSKAATGDNLLDLALFNYLELVAVEVGAGPIDFGGPLDPGATSGVVGLAVQNHGNVRLDTEVSGTALAHATEAASIPVGAVAYSDDAGMAGEGALSGSAATVPLDIATGASASADLYWRLSVPSGDDQWIPSGAYAGTVTVTALKAV